MDSVETWHIIAGALALLVSIVGGTFTLALKHFGSAFKHWGDKFDSFQLGVNKRLDHMEANFSNRLKCMEERSRVAEDSYHALTLQVERRVTWLEAHNSKHPLHPESPLSHNSLREEKEQR